MPKDDPAPVFLLDEILELARSSPEQAQAVAESIERKLASKSPIVKFKALRIIKHLCTKGCSTFQRCMQKQSGAVRELVHWRGEPDPFKGDVPNARVREFAKEVLEVLFNANPVASSAAASGSLAAQGRIQGFGSDGPGGAAPGRSSHSSGYGGGGGGGGGGGMGALAGAAASLEGPLAAGVATVAGAINDFLGNSGARTGLTGSRYGNTSPTRNGGGGGGYNNGGGGYGGFEPMGGYNGGGGGSSSSSAPRVTPSQVLGSEESVVGDVCAPGGLRPTPDAADLRRFVGASSAMDGLRLAEVLRAKMEGAGGWQVALRALCALEAVLQQGSSQAAGEVAVMFQSDPAPLQALATAPQALPYATAAPAAAAPAADLLSLDDEAPTPAAAAAAAPASALDLLGDLAGPPEPAVPPPAAAAAAAADSMFSGLEVGVAPAAQQTAAAVQDLFGGLSMSPEPPMAAAAVVRAAAGPPAVGEAQHL
ncbi:VHS domain-containing protein [Monoraphidium neglectum]|uniref:VHS domain-containing protein n=1 Tax=Monoraphidium neglectum TaxID=145388 RepID=A0A0D2MR59_9CHLO|nr:VHS domain-containing protein [Monoraphidium neglectum]KIZ05085.1 VHS domain-containing protein [Monoraphidium neglectum]|eukprot:XP_013904104.1 VHS domain-containing protein [Monoraphidium neglectum]